MSDRMYLNVQTAMFAIMASAWSKYNTLLVMRPQVFRYSSFVHFYPQPDLVHIAQLDCLHSSYTKLFTTVITMCACAMTMHNSLLTTFIASEVPP
jgi:hypothetical protein